MHAQLVRAHVEMAHQIMRTALVQLKACARSEAASEPVVASLECIAPSANNPSANVTAGYPGLGKRIKQLGSVAKCGGVAGAAYPSCP